MKTRFQCFLCWLLAALMLLSPNTFLLAQDVTHDDDVLLTDPAIVPVPNVPDAPLDVTYLLPQSCLVMSARPQAIFNSQFMKMMPLEVLQAASIEHTGIDALLMDRLLLSIEPPVGGPPNYALMASFTTPVANKLHPQIIATLDRQAESDRPHYKSKSPTDPSLYFPSDNVLIATPEATLQKFLLGGSTPTDASLHDRLLASRSDDLYVGVDFVPLRPMANMLMVQNPIPPQLQHFYTAPDLIKTIELRINISHPAMNELVIEANNADDAEKLEQIVIKTADMIKAEFSKEIERLSSDPDPVQQAMGRYQQRVMNELSTSYLPKRDGAKLFVFQQQGGVGQTNSLMAVYISGILVALLLPAVQASRQAAQRSGSMNNIKNILLSLLNYESAKRALPAHANYKDGKPLLSWRVHILPFLEQQALYEEFHLDEPWDSEHNKKLIPRMPGIFLDPSSALATSDGRTHYLGVKGKQGPFDGTENGKKLTDFTDGTSNTIVVLQVGDDSAVTWTKPEDWEFDPKNPLHGLTSTLHPGIFIAGYVDGHIQAINTAIDPEAFKKLLTISDGEVVSH